MLQSFTGVSTLTTIAATLVIATPVCRCGTVTNVTATFPLFSAHTDNNLHYSDRNESDTVFDGDDNSTSTEMSETEEVIARRRVVCDDTHSEEHSESDGAI